MEVIQLVKDSDEVTINFQRAEHYKQTILVQGYLWNEEADQPLHRVVAEDCLGHSIDAGMNVHHIDHNKKNNTPQNLIVVTEWVHMLLHAAHYYSHGFGYGPFKRITDPAVLITHLHAEGIPFEWCGEDDANT